MATTLPSNDTSDCVAGSVRVDADDAIHITRAIVITDAAAAAQVIRGGVRRGEPAEAVLARLLEIAGRSVMSVGGTLELVEARDMFEATAQQATDTFTASAASAASALTTEVDRILTEDLSRLLGDHAAALERTLTETFDPALAGAVPHRVSRQVEAALAHAQRTLLDEFQGAGSPLARIQETVTTLLGEQARAQAEAMRQLSEGIVSVRESLAEMRGGAEAAADAGEELRRERERGNGKGYSFEESVGDLLMDVAALHGDVAEDVTTIPGVKGMRTGDLLASLGAVDVPVSGGGKVVWELKTGRMSLREALRVLDDALTARNADFAILAVPGEDLLPRGTRGFQVFEANKMVVGLTGLPEMDREVVRLAHLFSRARVQALRARGGDLDAPAIQAAIDAAGASLRGAQGILTTLNAAAANLRRGQDSLKDMMREISARLAEVEGILASNPAADSEVEP